LRAAVVSGSGATINCITGRLWLSATSCRLSAKPAVCGGQLSAVGHQPEPGPFWQL